MTAILGFFVQLPFQMAAPAGLTTLAGWWGWWVFLAVPVLPAYYVVELLLMRVLQKRQMIRVEKSSLERHLKHDGLFLAIFGIFLSLLPIFIMVSMGFGY